MELGFAGINVGTLATPELGQLAQLAEELGYESLWTAEHIVLTDSPDPPRPGTLPFLDSVAVIGYLAALTKRLKLATGVLLLPQHKPQVLAKQLASLDVLSRGRLIVGIGVGAVEAEARALGIRMSERGSRATEYLEAMLALWTMPHPSYHGRHVSFDGINAYPRPVQRPHPPLVVGGRSEGAYRRMVRFAAGWYGYALSLEQTRELVGALREAMQRYERGPGLGELEITVHPREEVTPRTIEAYAALGVHRLLLSLPRDLPLAESEKMIRDHAPAKLGVAG
jgi:probable F420-dependent oxidoreductase